MSRKHFSWLLLVTFLVAVAVLLVPGKTGRESAFQPSLLLPGAASVVNDIDWLRVTAAGNEAVVTLQRGEGAWTVEEAAGYPADWNRVRTLLADLSRAETVEPKTANPDYYPRLGVEAVDSPEAGGVMIEFSEASGLPAVIVGKSAQGRDGQYARLSGQAQSVLLDRRLVVPSQRMDWLDKSIVDISEAEVVEVGIVHPDGETVRATKASADDENFHLEGVPEGRAVRSDWTVNTLAGAQQAMTLDAVVPDSELDWDGAIRHRLLTADGLLIESDLVAVETGEESEQPASEYWVRLQASVYTTAVESAAGDAGDAEGASERAREINERVGGWAYRIPRYKYDTMSKRMEDLLEAME